MLGVKYPSQLYKEAHAGNHAMIRTKGDKVVNHMIDSRLESESAWSGKFFTATHMQTLWQRNIQNGLFEETRIDESHSTKRIKEKNAKKAMINSIKQETLANRNAKVRKLTFQGSFVDLLIE